MSSKQAGLGSRILELLSGSRKTTLADDLTFANATHGGAAATHAHAQKAYRDADKLYSNRIYPTHPNYGTDKSLHGGAKWRMDEAGSQLGKARTSQQDALNNLDSEAKKVLATRLGLTAGVAGGLGSGITHHVKESSAQEVPQAYVEGFIAKCAEFSIDPEVLLKALPED